MGQEASFGYSLFLLSSEDGRFRNEFEDCLGTPNGKSHIVPSFAYQADIYKVSVCRWVEVKKGLQNLQKKIFNYFMLITSLIFNFNQQFLYFLPLCFLKDSPPPPKTPFSLFAQAQRPRCHHLLPISSFYLNNLLHRSLLHLPPLQLLP